MSSHRPCSIVTAGMGHMPGMCRASAGYCTHNIHPLLCSSQQANRRLPLLPSHTDEETEAQRKEGTCPGHRVVKWGDRFELRQVTFPAWLLNQPLRWSLAHLRMRITWKVYKTSRIRIPLSETLGATSVTHPHCPPKHPCPSLSVVNLFSI